MPPSLGMHEKEVYNVYPLSHGDCSSAVCENQRMEGQQRCARTHVNCTRSTRAVYLHVPRTLIYVVVSEDVSHRPGMGVLLAL
jgi:hypothetical protein